MTFSTFDIDKILGIKRSSLQQWMNSGFIEPSEEEALGRGTKNRFSRSDLYKIAAFWTLSLAGISQKDAGRISRTLDFMAANPNSVRYGVLRYEVELGGRIQGAPKLHVGHSLEALLRSQGPYLQLVINFSEIVSEVDKRIEAHQKTIRANEGGEKK